MNPIYDTIGHNYSENRKTDPEIERQIHSKLEGATKIINIGAGTGSYEPQHLDLVAVEPSEKMITQRHTDAHPVVQASAEALPFADNSFSHALTILSMHHWKDREKAFQEIKRVATHKFVALSWNPAAPPFWLTRDYFPEIFEADLDIFPTTQELESHFKHVTITPLLIPQDCQDGFLAAFWKRPAAYLNPAIRNSISTFAKLKNMDEGLKQLEADLADGTWEKANHSVLSLDKFDTGYIMIEAVL